MMVEKEIGEIGRMERLKKQKEDRIKSRTVEDRQCRENAPNMDDGIAKCRSG
jgi:hypothetical protein